MKSIRKSALLVCCLLASMPLAVSARALTEVGAIRVWVVPVGDVSNVSNQPLSVDNVAKRVGAMLATRGYQWQQITSGPLKPGTTTLRVLYSVNQQSTPSGTAIAVAASTQLLQTAVIGGGKASVSFYAGLQQSLAQGATAKAALQSVDPLFVKQLKNRVDAALDRLETRPEQ